MSDTPNESSRPKRRKSWLGLLAGVVGLLLVWLVALVAEPYLYVLAVGPAEPEGMRSSAGSWANTNVWLAAVAAASVALCLVGFVSARLSAPGSMSVPAVLLLLIVAYVFFAQFPATRSALRIGLWSLALPLCFALGSWLGIRPKTAA